MENLTLKETAVGLHELYVNLQEAGFTKKEAMDKAKEHGVDVSDMRLITSDYGDDDDED